LFGVFVVCVVWGFGWGGGGWGVCGGGWVGGGGGGLFSQYGYGISFVCFKKTHLQIARIQV